MKRIIPSLITLSLTIGFASCNSCGNKEVKVTGEKADSVVCKATVDATQEELPLMSLEEVLHPDSIAADTAGTGPGWPYQWRYGDHGYLYNDNPEYVQKAKALIEEAKHTNNSDKLLQLARFYDYGFGLPEDDKMAMVYYAKAAAMGNAQALYCLSRWYDSLEPRRAKTLLTHAALNGYIVDMRDVAEEKRKEYLEILTAQAQIGNTKAQYELGHCYKEGIVVEKDTITGNMWIKKSGVKVAEQSDSYGLVDAWLDGYLEGGWPFYTDDKWSNINDCVAAAHAGNADAQCYLGQCYLVGNTNMLKIISHPGIGDAPDARTAAMVQSQIVTFEFQWDDLRDVEASFHRLGWGEEEDEGYKEYSIGALFKSDKIFKRDYAEAVKWFKLAAKQGHVGAKDFLGRCYFFGLGVPQDYRKAIELWGGPKDISYEELITKLKN